MEAVKPVVLGPLSYLALGKSKDGIDKLRLLSRLTPVYRELVEQLRAEAIEWLQIDEPILVTELSPAWKTAFEQAYSQLESGGVKLMLTTYFGRLAENLELVNRLPVHGFHLDAVRARSEIDTVVQSLPSGRVLSLGIVDGRNIWKSDLNALLEVLEPVAQWLGERLWIAPSCSLVHVPVDLDSERKLDPEIRSWLAFALQKLAELQTLATALNQGRSAVAEELTANRAAIVSRRESPRVTNPEVRAAIANVSAEMGNRRSPYPVRAQKQAARLKLPLYPTTTIGSFPQTAEIRQVRNHFR
ncbi:MAG TPA: hypothetical protein VKX25_12970, partial [Bryobacteraceae bacterium]|nr:hypothetical protein [Bryobacteraceae bacterium]